MSTIFLFMCRFFGANANSWSCTVDKNPKNVQCFCSRVALFLHSDDIIRLLEQNGRLLHKLVIFVLMISLGLMKSSEVRKAGD